jgi:hypothetical protein
MLFFPVGNIYCVCHIYMATWSIEVLTGIARTALLLDLEEVNHLSSNTLYTNTIEGSAMPLLSSPPTM